MEGRDADLVHETRKPRMASRLCKKKAYTSAASQMTASQPSTATPADGPAYADREVASRRGFRTDQARGSRDVCKAQGNALLARRNVPKVTQRTHKLALPEQDALESSLPFPTSRLIVRLTNLNAGGFARRQHEKRLERWN
jgi:hypothetical protein